MPENDRNASPAIPASAIEGLGEFYLGLQADEPGTPPWMYDSGDLTTHAVVLGMTGSGKTGLCVTLLEEAGLDGIPALVIDPKGDIGNLLLTFPDLEPGDFRPWIDEAEAERKGLSPDDYAEATANRWREGLEGSGQDGARIARLRAAVDIPIYTPGASHGLPIAVLRSFEAPGESILADADALTERISAAVSGLLSLAGIDAEPMRSREHILLSRILERGWTSGRDFDLGALIRDIQSPGFDRVGVLDLESFFPERDRFKLATALNNLLAAPGFESWLEGPPIDIPSLLWTPEGQPRIAICSIAHLDEPERMFFVTLLLNELLSWARSQPGTSSLRAILYIDEVMGYLPPTRNPPSKSPLLTLLKQARAYGLGIVLATQNPVDLDYKGLGNTGTWFLGRLQTERDKEKVIDGLESASGATEGGLDRKQMDRILSGLEKRTFLVGNVHSDAPLLIRSRWAMSYLRGPLTRPEIRRLMAGRRSEPSAGAAAHTGSSGDRGAATGPETAESGRVDAARARSAPDLASDRPMVPPELREVFLAPLGSGTEASPPVLRPALLGLADLHYVRKSLGVDVWEDVAILSPLDDASDSDPWAGAAELQSIPDLDHPAPDPALFASVPARAIGAKQRRSWPPRLKAWLYRERPLRLYRIPALKLTSNPGESESAFRVRAREEARSARSEAVSKIRDTYRRKVASIDKKLEAAHTRLDREQSQYDSQKLESFVGIGSTLLETLLGGRSLTGSKATTAARRVSRAASQRDDVKRVEKQIEDLEAQLGEIEIELADELEHARADWSPESLKLEEVVLAPRKSEIGVEMIALAWRPDDPESPTGRSGMQADEDLR
ncbi:MAG: DUF87 domain-containing protein [marine benthic group bacterium]|nr:DUF87 domain-containing protein [Candidatus Carthagonibacter metallireducens]